jgi:hypothetical protein
VRITPREAKGLCAPVGSCAVLSSRPFGDICAHISAGDSLFTEVILSRPTSAGNYDANQFGQNVPKGLSVIARKVPTPGWKRPYKYGYTLAPPGSSLSDCFPSSGNLLALSIYIKTFLLIVYPFRPLLYNVLPHSHPEELFSLLPAFSSGLIYLIPYPYGPSILISFSVYIYPSTPSASPSSCNRPIKIEMEQRELTPAGVLARDPNHVFCVGGRTCLPCRTCAGNMGR